MEGEFEHGCDDKWQNARLRVTGIQSISQRENKPSRGVNCTEIHTHTQFSRSECCEKEGKVCERESGVGGLKPYFSLRLGTTTITSLILSPLYIYSICSDAVALVQPPPLALIAALSSVTIRITMACKGD